MQIEPEFFSDRELGLVFAAFTVAYGLFEVVTGHWGDRYGSLSAPRIVIWWSLFTAATGGPATG